MATAWDQNPRHIGFRVLIDAVDVLPFIVGTVAVSREGVLPTCDFTLFTPLLAYHATGSYSAGPRPVQVYVSCWARGFVQTEELVFDGLMEAPSNTGLYIPQGQVHAIGSLSTVANTPGCLLVGGFAEQTRVELLEAFAEAALCALTIDGALVTSGTVTKPVDLQGITVLGLTAKYGTIDGWEAREKDGTLQLIPHTAMAGPTAVSAFGFTRSNYFSTSETAPSRPVTKYIVAGQATCIAPDGTVVTVDGNTTISVTTVDGAITTQVTEVRGDYTPLGTTPQTPLVDTVLTRETITNTYDMAAGLPTAQLTARTRVKEAWYAPKSATGAGAGDFTFTDGSFHREIVETLQETERIEEAYTWDVTGCYKSSSTSIRSGWPSPPVETTDDGTYTDPGTVWPDGITRLGAYETYIVQETIETVDKYAPTLGAISIWDGYWAQVHHRGRMRYHMHHRYFTLVGNNRSREYISILWLENADGTRHQVLTREPKILKRYTGVYIATWWDPSGPRVEDVNEPLPAPPIASPTQRQFSMVPFVVTDEVIGTGFEDKTASEFNEVLESDAEATKLIRWRERLDFADQITVSHPFQPPSVFRELDAGTVDDPARVIAAKPDWAKSVRYEFEPANGRARQTTVVCVDPYPTESPLGDLA